MYPPVDDTESLRSSISAGNDSDREIIFDYYAYHSKSGDNFLYESVVTIPKQISALLQPIIPVLRLWIFFSVGGLFFELAVLINNQYDNFVDDYNEELDSLHNFNPNYAYIIFYKTIASSYAINSVEYILLSNLKKIDIKILNFLPEIIAVFSLFLVLGEIICHFYKNRENNQYNISGNRKTWKQWLSATSKVMPVFSWAANLDISTRYIWKIILPSVAIISVFYRFALLQLLPSFFDNFKTAKDAFYCELVNVDNVQCTQELIDEGAVVCSEFDACSYDANSIGIVDAGNILIYDLTIKTALPVFGIITAGFTLFALGFIVLEAILCVSARREYYNFTQPMNEAMLSLYLSGEVADSDMQENLSESLLNKEPHRIVFNYYALKNNFHTTSLYHYAVVKPHQLYALVQPIMHCVRIWVFLSASLMLLQLLSLVVTQYDELINNYNEYFNIAKINNEYYLINQGYAAYQAMFQMIYNILESLDHPAIRIINFLPEILSVTLLMFTLVYLARHFLKDVKCDNCLASPCLKRGFFGETDQRNVASAAPQINPLLRGSE